MRLRGDRGASPVRAGRVEAPGVPRQGDGAGLRRAMVADGGRLSPDAWRIERALLGQPLVKRGAAPQAAGGVLGVGLAPRVVVEVG